MVSEYWLGPHTPRLRAEDVDAIHDVWLDATTDPELACLHHYHIVRVAVEDLAKMMHGAGRDAVLEQLKSEMKREPETGKVLSTGTGEPATESTAQAAEVQPPAAEH